MTIKIGYISDLHTEFFDEHKWKSLIDSLSLDVDILILAGDIGNFYNIEDVLLYFSSKTSADIVYVPGNHEYYGHNIQYVDAMLFNLRIPRVHILIDEFKTIREIPFFGGTGWFSEPSSTISKYSLSDFRLIKEFEPFVYKLNRITIKMLKTSEAKIVVTHHIPSEFLIDDNYKGNPLSHFFAFDGLQAVKKLPDIWIYGHTHTQSEKTINDEEHTCKLVCNPLGYPHENNPIEVKVIEYVQD